MLIGHYKNSFLKTHIKHSIAQILFWLLTKNPNEIPEEAIESDLQINRSKNTQHDQVIIKEVSLPNPSIRFEFFKNSYSKHVGRYYKRAE